MCLLCPFPIVKAISVRLQYFKDETKQSTCLGNQKSPLVCPFSGEQGLSSSSSPDLLFSPPPSHAPASCPPGGPCLCPCLCPWWGATSHPHCRLSVCVCCPVQDGRSRVPWLEQRSAGCVQEPRASPDPTCEPHLDTGVDSRCSEGSPCQQGPTDLEGGARAQSMHLGSGQRLSPRSCRRAGEPSRAGHPGWA